MQSIDLVDNLLDISPVAVVIIPIQPGNVIPYINKPLVCLIGRVPFMHHIVTIWRVPPNEQTMVY